MPYTIFNTQIDKVFEPRKIHYLNEPSQVIWLAHALNDPMGWLALNWSFHECTDFKRSDTLEGPLKWPYGNQQEAFILTWIYLHTRLRLRGLVVSVFLFRQGRENFSKLVLVYRSSTPVHCNIQAYKFLSFGIWDCNEYEEVLQLFYDMKGDIKHKWTRVSGIQRSIEVLAPLITYHMRSVTSSLSSGGFLTKRCL